MTTTFQSPQEKEAIVAEYLLGNATYRQLAQKYDVDFRIIHSWVMKFKGNNNSNSKPVSKETENVTKKEATCIVALREELRKEKLRAELLSTMIDIAEKDFKISIRKKFGTKQ